jgi:uncharacterized repeat protein (TIGR03803 family)
MDPERNLYGMTFEGFGGGTAGTLFELSPSDGGWTEQVIYNVSPDINDGMTMDAAGNIFGTEVDGVFELSPNGTGGWTPTTIYNFGGGDVRAHGPVLDQAGNLYGTTFAGGTKNAGTVWKLSLVTTGKEKGTWTEKILYSFKGGTIDGAEPTAGVVLDAAGNIYGTTYNGGKNDGKYPGGGTVFELVAPVGAGSYTEKVLWSFTSEVGYAYPDGAFPRGGVILDSAGNLYGTTELGGSGNGIGVVFKVTVPTAWTTPSLTPSLNPSTYGEAVTFTAVVTSKLGAPPDGETVSFMKGTTVLGTGALSGGSASFTTSTLPVGTNAIKAAYGGDSKFGYSTSKAVDQVVNKATTTTTLTSSPNPSNVGQAVTFTVSVAPQFSGTVKGSVTFYDGTTALKTASLSGGAAKFTTKTLTAGTHSITATYNGSTSFTGSSASLTQTVN